MHLVFTLLVGTGLAGTMLAGNSDEATAMGKIAFARKDYRAAAEHFQRAKELAAGVPRLRAAAATNLGSVEYTVGRIREAVVQFREALEQWESVGTECQGARLTLRNLASGLSQIGEYEEARRVVKRLQGLLEGDERPDAAEMQSLRLSLAQIENATGNPLQAEKHYREVLAKAGEEMAVRAKALDGLGDVALKLGRFAEAEHSYTRALELWEGMGNAIHVAASANRLGDRWLNEREHRRALPYLERARVIFEGAGVSGTQLVSTLNNIAQAYRFGGDRKSAGHYLERALGIAIRDLGKDHPMVAAIELNLGDLSMSLRQYEEAESHLRQALEIQKRRLGGYHPEVAIATARLAKLHALRKQYRAASDEFGSALAIHERSRFPLTLQQAEWFEVRADLLRKEQNFAEAAKLDAEAMRIRVKHLLRN